MKLGFFRIFAHFVLGRPISIVHFKFGEKMLEESSSKIWYVIYDSTFFPNRFVVVLDIVQREVFVPFLDSNRNFCELRYENEKCFAHK